MRYTRFTNCYLCDNGTLDKKDLYIDNRTGTIISKPNSADVDVIDLGGEILAPGLLDIQNNGIYGLNYSNLNENSTDKDIRDFKRFYNDAMAKYLTTGVTSVCPTVTSNFPEVYKKVLPLYKRSRSLHQSDSLGAHLEGPFISHKKKGCHPVETFVTAQDANKMVEVYGDENLLNNVCIVTAAPEIPGVLDLIPSILEKNIVFSIGHTLCDYDTALKAVEKGATMITHLYNAMPQPHHREVGVVGLIDTPDVENKPYFGLIADGVHVHPSMVAIAYNASPEKFISVTDAMHLIGLPDGSYKWDDRYIIKSGTRLYLKGTDTLAGAATTLPECLRNLVEWTGITLAEAIKTATNNPALSLGIQGSKGFLNVGCDADLVVFDKHGYVKRIFKLGKEVKTSDQRALTASL